MQINWFTVIAQVINFLILVWLLKRYLYKPILDAIDEREKKIVAQIADADAKKAEALKEQDEFKQKNVQFDQEKKSMMDKAVADTNAERTKLLETARNDADALRTKQEKAVAEKEEALNRDIAVKVQQGVFDMARKTLADIASVSLEEQAANNFIKRLDDLKIDEKAQFTAAFKPGANPATVRSAFVLTDKQQENIKNAIDKIIGTGWQGQFRVEPALISGIELSANGYKLGWTVSGYLDSLEKSISDAVKEKPTTETEKK
jgi:F-type H+-transporting ATPase subunit b